MGFRNPVLTAEDPTARELAVAAAADAASAAYLAEHGIIPGSRLAADAIDGKTITGATLYSGPQDGAHVAIRQETIAPPGTPDAYESYGAIRMQSANPDVPPARLGVWSDDDPGGLHPVTRLQAGDTASTGLEPSLYQYVTERPDLGAGVSEAVTDIYSDRLYLDAELIHGPGKLDLANGADLPRVQSYAGVPLTGPRSGVHLYNEGAGGSATSVMDLYAKRFWLGSSGGLLESDTEIRTTQGMRSAWHSWNGVDNFGLTFVAPDAGWTAGLNHYMIRGGWVWWTCRLARTSWAANQRICGLPVSFPPADLDVATVNDNGAASGAVRIRASDGAMFCVNAGGPGIHFTAVWPHKL